VDQIKLALAQLRHTPSDRRIIIDAWNPEELDLMALPPCHALWVLNVQDPDGDPHLCLHWTQRSCDLFLGVPFNIGGYAFMLHLMAHLSGFRPGILSASLVDAHIYTCKPDGTMGGAVGNDGKPITKDHDHMPMLKEQLTREPRPLPTLTIDDSIKELSDVEALLDAPKDEILDIFKLEGYDPHPPLRGAVAV
jgi:thymidylate synthase